jgi:carbamoyl-phosphate synthase large subunit
MEKINNNLNILIFPSGSGVAKEIFDSLKYIRWINIIGSDFNDKNFSYYEFKNLELDAPFIKDENDTILYLKNIIKKHNIDCIYPAFDSMLVFLKNKEKELDVKIICSPIETCNLCISKLKTYNLLHNFIKTPKILDINTIDNYPVFIKPDKGYGSRDSFKINNKDELLFYTKKINDYIICEYLPGDEFTIDCFTSKKNGLLFCEARKRVKAVNGLSILTEHCDIPEIKNIACIINEKIIFEGSWFFQVKYNNENKLTLLEIAPRIPGAAALHRAYCFNAPLLSIYEHYNINIDYIPINNYTNNISCYKITENKYNLNLLYDVVYIDLDDTIIIKNKVNTKIIQFLYYIKNENKRIILITRNNDPYSYLKKYKITEELFDNIILINNKNDKKSSFITEKNSIFIDDSYSEREDVRNICKINVFNCDIINVLLNEKF